MFQNVFKTFLKCFVLAVALFGDVEKDRDAKEEEEEDSVFFHRCLTPGFFNGLNIKVCMFYILMLGAYYLKLKNFA